MWNYLSYNYGLFNCSDKFLFNGSIPFGFILTKLLLKKDIREIGSGNIGATNALRTGNKLLGYTTLILDILKAIIPVIYVKLNYPDLIFITSLSIFLGHVFPVWLKFKGGKRCCYICWNSIFIEFNLWIYFCKCLVYNFFSFKIFFTFFTRLLLFQYQFIYTLVKMKT